MESVVDAETMSEKEKELQKTVEELLLNQKKLQHTIDEKNFDNQTLRNCLKNCEDEISHLQKKIQTEAPHTISTEEIHQMLPMLSKNQLSLMTEEKKRVNWTNDEIATGFALSYFSRRGYNYVIHKLQIPQPSIRTLQQWAENMSVKPGILTDSLLVLKGLRETLTEGESQVIVSFDEMKCKSLYQYNRTLDAIMGPHRNMQTVMVRGLFGKFKQPVYIDFDQSVTDDLLDTIITKLYEVGYNTVGCVSDNGGGNIGLLKRYGVTLENTYIVHPVTGEKIYMFSDAPHLLKLLRNWFIDGGFLLKDGSELNQGKIRELLKSNTEISPIYKLSVKHLEVEKHERQNVRLACELFSHTVAQSLRRNFPSNKEAITLSNFIELVNKWFDVMNSYSINGIGFKKPYGLSLEEQNVVLDDMYATIEGMRCFNKNKKLLDYLQIFQKGILMSIKSLKSLYSDMQHNFDYAYILTHRLNQDCLENLFSQVRGRNGANDHPSPEECLNRMKNIILGKNPGICARMHTNTVDKVPDEYASACFNNLLRSDDNRNEMLDAVLELNEDEPTNEQCETNYDIPTEFLQTECDALPHDLMEVDSRADEYLNVEYLDEDVVDFTDEIFTNEFDATECDALPHDLVEVDSRAVDEYLSEEFLDEASIHQPAETSGEYLDVEYLDEEVVDFTDEFIRDLSTDMKIDEIAVRTKRSTEDGLEYIAGWISFKFKQQHPQFSRSRREDVPTHISDHTYAEQTIVCSNSWVDCVSYGGLTKPTAEMMQWVKDLEEKFLQIHGTEFNGRKNVRKELVETLLSEREHVPNEVVQLFAKARIYMRCKYLNKKRIEEAMLKSTMNKGRSLKRKTVEPDDALRAKGKKMKKIVL